MCGSDCVILCVCVPLLAEILSSRRGKLDFYKGRREYSPPPSPTFSSSPGVRIETKTALQGPTCCCFCHIYVQNMPGRIIPTWLTNVCHLRSLLTSSSGVANMQFKTQNLPLLNQIHLPNFCWPTKTKECSLVPLSPAHI